MHSLFTTSTHAIVVFQEWVNGVAEGKGVRIYSDTSRYEGDFTNGYREGAGVLFFVDGSCIKAPFVGDMANGNGELIDPTRGRYVGAFVNGVRNGRGRFDWHSGDYYDGEWAMHMENGSGLLLLHSLVHLASNLCFRSSGIKHFSNGDHFEGTFVNGERDGPGYCEYTNGGLSMLAFRLTVSHSLLLFLQTNTKDNGTMIEKMVTVLLSTPTETSTMVRGEMENVQGKVPVRTAMVPHTRVNGIAISETVCFVFFHCMLHLILL